MIQRIVFLYLSAFLRFSVQIYNIFHKTKLKFIHFFCNPLTFNYFPFYSSIISHKYTTIYKKREHKQAFPYVRDNTLIKKIICFISKHLHSRVISRNHTHTYTLHFPTPLSFYPTTPISTWHPDILWQIRSSPFYV